MDHKLAVILDATPRLRAEPLDSTSTLEQRELAANATRHELERNNWEGIREDVLLNASIGKAGIAMVRTEIDKLSSEHKIKIDVVDPGRFMPDPYATRLENCRYVCYEASLPTSQILDMFPERGHLVKPSGQTPGARLRPTSETRARSYDEIVYGAGREIALTGNEARERKADVVMCWIKDESLTEDTMRHVVRESWQGLMCLDCGLRFEEQPVCPNCGSENLAPEMVSAVEEEQTVIRRAYPFGRWIVYSGDIQLYDGPNPLELDTVFPFAVYVHYRVPNRFWGYGDVDLLKSPQMMADKNMSQLLDAQRMTGMGVLEYPKEATMYDNLGNEPGQKVAVPIYTSGKARWVRPEGYNVQLHSVADETLIRDFQRVSGVSDVSIGTSPSAPTSGVEVQARQRAAATRVGRHLKNFNKFSSDLATLVWKVMNQYYVGPRPFMMGTGSAFEAAMVDVSMLPRNLHIRVEADVDALEKDKLIGQNLVMAMQGGVIPPMPDILLRALGIPEPVINEVMQRIQMMQMQQMAQMAAGPGAPPLNGGSGPPAGTPPGPDNERIPYERTAD